MGRTGWIVVIAVLLITLFAVLVGGFFWPRPQFQRGPWAGPGEVPGDSAGARIGGDP